MILSKQRIAKRFSKSIHSYEEEATVQKQIAQKLIEKISSIGGLQPNKILEIGCGNGLLTQPCMQRYKHALYTLNDLCDNLREVLDQKLPLPYRFIHGDAENTLFDAGQDLILSSSVFQWFQRPQSFIQYAHKLLNKQGILAFTTFGPNNLIEIRNTTGASLTYYSLSDWVSWLTPYFSILEAKEESCQLYFPTPKDVLRHLQKTGVNSLSDKRWGKHDLQKFTENYIQQFGHPSQQVTLTYHPIYIIAQKQ